MRITRENMSETTGKQKLEQAIANADIQQATAIAKNAVSRQEIHEIFNTKEKRLLALESQSSAAIAAPTSN